MHRHWIALLLTLIVTTSAQPSDRYFVTFFASQDGAASPPATHTFACFVKARFDDTKNPNQVTAVESFTISWLPAGGPIRLLNGPEPGKNFNLAETMAWAEKLGLATTTWGPFELRKEGFAAAAKQLTRLKSGTVEYKALDLRFRPDIATNCIHAVSDIVPGPLLNTGTARGNAATQLVVQHFGNLLIDSERTHAWVSAYHDRNQKVESSSP